MSTNREKIEQVAAIAIQRGGLGNVSFRTLADEVGIKSASVHYHFPQKSDLVNALVDRYRTLFETLFAEFDHEAGSLRDALDRFIAVFEQVVEDGRVCLCGMLAAEAASVPDDTRARIDRFFGGVERWLEKQFRQHAEELRTDLPPDVLASILLAGLEGAAMMDRAVDRRAHLEAQRALVEDWLR